MKSEIYLTIVLRSQNKYFLKKNPFKKGQPMWPVDWPTSLTQHFFFLVKRNFIKTTKENTKDQDKACLQPSPGNQPEQEAPSPQADKKRN